MYSGIETQSCAYLHQAQPLDSVEKTRRVNLFGTNLIEVPVTPLLLLIVTEVGL